MSDNPLIAADFGNSFVKFLIFGRMHFIKYKRGWKNQVVEILPEFPDLVYSSVNSQRSNEFLEWNEIKLSQIIKAEDLLRNLSGYDFSGVKGAGIDRKIGIFAAAEIHGLPIITADCGTAVTINAMDDFGLFLGGCIFPGITTQRDSLFAGTKEIGKIKLDPSSQAAGRNTQAAVTSGIFRAVSGGIEKIYKEICVEEFGGKAVRFIITGGWSQEIIPFLDQNLINLTSEPTLNLRGLILLARKIREY